MLYTRESFPVPVQTINKTPIDEWKGQGSSMVIYVDHQQKAWEYFAYRFRPQIEVCLCVVIFRLCIVQPKARTQEQTNVQRRLKPQQCELLRRRKELVH